MTDTYTPTTEEVRDDYAHFQVPGGTAPVTGEFAEGRAEFDRWLAAIERAAAARALEEFVDDYEDIYADSEMDMQAASMDYWRGADDAVKHAMQKVRARAEAYRQERGEQ